MNDPVQRRVWERVKVGAVLLTITLLVHLVGC